MLPGKPHHVYRQKGCSHHAKSRKINRNRKGRVKISNIFPKQKPPTYLKPGVFVYM